MTAAAAVLLMVVGAACAGDDGQSPGDSPKPAGQQTSTTAAAAEIDQLNLEFVPAEVKVKVGDVVLIRNSEPIIHNAVINGLDVTGNMKKGAAVPWTAAAAGEYAVTCDYHPLMKATIIVTP